MKSQDNFKESLAHSPDQSAQDSSKSFLSLRRVVILILLAGASSLALGIFFYILFANARLGELQFIPSPAVESLEINIPMGDILLSSWDKDYISFSFEFSQRTFSRKQIIATEKGNLWELKWDHSFSPSDWKTLDLPIFKIRFPEKKIRDLQFRVNYGCVEIEKFHDWNLSGFLTSGKMIIHPLSASSGDLQVGWGYIEVTSPPENKLWKKSTGFESTVQTGGDKTLRLRVHMGNFKTGALED